MHFQPSARFGTLARRIACVVRSLCGDQQLLRQRLQIVLHCVLVQGKYISRSWCALLHGRNTLQFKYACIQNAYLCKRCDLRGSSLVARCCANFAVLWMKTSFHNHAHRLDLWGPHQGAPVCGARRAVGVVLGGIPLPCRETNSLAARIRACGEDTSPGSLSAAPAGFRNG